MIPLMDDPEPRTSSDRMDVPCDSGFRRGFRGGHRRSLHRFAEADVPRRQGSCLRRALGRRKQLAAEKSTALIDLQHSSDRLKQIDDELNAEGCP